jgi:hypothetical protein
MNAALFKRYQFEKWTHFPPVNSPSILHFKKNFNCQFQFQHFHLEIKLTAFSLNFAINEPKRSGGVLGRKLTVISGACDFLPSELRDVEYSNQLFIEGSACSAGLL